MIATAGADRLQEGMRREKISTLQKKIHTMSQMGKEPIIAVIERRGEIIYYKVSTSVFAQNSR